MLIELTATKIKDSYKRTITVIKDDKGKIKAIFPNSLRQPRRGTKTIIINCNKYKLKWN